MGESALVQEFRASDGTVLGIVVKGELFVPIGHGLILQDVNGNYWRTVVDTDGGLSTTQVTL
jgi:hypothetical protein